MDFFDIVPDNFFSLLASKNKRIYLASIIQVFKVYETGSILGIDKKIVVDDLTYFLETNSSYLYDVEDDEDEEANPQSKRDLANYILRRMEECGWIYIDVTDDYEEILNFSDVAITMCESLIKVYPQFEYGDDIPDDYINPNEYHGYIYQIYSLLNQEDNIDYGLTFSLVYSNTKQLIRSLRRLDARMKEYIVSVVENSEIKDLMERLINYKNEVYDKNYMKLKVSDNINRYKLSIITHLTEMQQNPTIVEIIAKDYETNSLSPDAALQRAVRNIDEVIDAFNAIDSFINEIDVKNRNYINSTIGKVKFLLSEEDNVIGKLNTILKYVKTSAEQGNVDKAIRVVEGLYEIRQQKVLDGSNSLYTPRGTYERNYNQILDQSGIDLELTDEFIKQFKTSYDEKAIESFVEANNVDGKLRASDIITYDCDDITFLMTIYAVIYAVDRNMKIELCDNIIDNRKYRLRDFIIYVGGM